MMSSFFFYLCRIRCYQAFFENMKLIIFRERERERGREMLEKESRGILFIQLGRFYNLVLTIFHTHFSSNKTKKLKNIPFVRLLSFLSFSLYHTPFQKWYVLSNDCRSRTACTTTTTTATSEFGTHLTINSIKDLQGCKESRKSQPFR